MENSEKNTKSRAHKILQCIVMHILPAVGTLYFALSEIWGFPHCEKIIGTVTAIETFLGGIAAIIYSKQQKAESTAVIDSKSDDGSHGET